MERRTAKETQNDMLRNRIYHFKFSDRIGEEEKVGVKKHKLRLFNSYTHVIKRPTATLLHFIQRRRDTKWHKKHESPSTIVGNLQLLSFTHKKEKYKM